ncbi:hypothetical protein BDZ45DRAFT_783603 [Acephala macrosclerotiorum]|nr:hypothetical protein BDZ45DRAFT_783603 [Acephala macrosclerotiorum]
MLLQRQGKAPDQSRLAKGSMYSNAFLSIVRGLPEEENCSLWIKNIADDRYAPFFDLIREGWVWSLYIKPPIDGHPLYAATLVFMSPDAAQAFRFRANGLFYAGSQLSIEVNRDGVRRRTTAESRVLLIDGPPHIVTWQNIEAEFKVACVYNLDRWLFTQSSNLALIRMEVRFSCIDGQAQICKQKLD